MYALDITDISMW